MIWKVKYYKSDFDWYNDIRTVIEFNNFEAARDFFILMTGNHRGSVWLIHPDVE